MATIQWFFLSWMLFANLFTPETPVTRPETADPLESKSVDLQQSWVDSVFNSLTFEERLGQLFMVAAYSNKDQAHVDQISALIEEENLGGLIFFQGGPDRQARLTNYYLLLINSS